MGFYAAGPSRDNSFARSSLFYSWPNPEFILFIIRRYGVLGFWECPEELVPVALLVHMGRFQRAPSHLRLNRRSIL